MESFGNILGHKVVKTLREMKKLLANGKLDNDEIFDQYFSLLYILANFEC